MDELQYEWLFLFTKGYTTPPSSGYEQASSVKWIRKLHNEL